MVEIREEEYIQERRQRRELVEPGQPRECGKSDQKG